MVPFGDASQASGRLSVALELRCTKRRLDRMRLFFVFLVALIVLAAYQANQNACHQHGDVSKFVDCLMD
jgi:hypothetical protein